MAIFQVASERKIVKKRGILAAHMYMENIGSTPPPPGFDLVPKPDGICSFCIQLYIYCFSTVKISSFYIGLLCKGDICQNTWIKRRYICFFTIIQRQWKTRFLHVHLSVWPCSETCMSMFRNVLVININAMKRTEIVVISNDQQLNYSWSCKMMYLISLWYAKLIKFTILIKFLSLIVK